MGWGAIHGPDFELTGASNSMGCPESGLIVLVGDIQPVQLPFVGVLPHTVVVEPEVHRGCIGCPQPERELGGLGMRVANVDLGGKALPEIPDTEDQPAAGAPNRSEERRVGEEWVSTCS